MTDIVVAAVQPRLQAGEVETNLARIEDLVRDAHRDFRPDVIVLPESMTSPVIADDRVRAAPRHIDGAPLNLLRQLATELDCVMTGGALSVRGRHTYQTYLLVEPSGAIYLHNKVVLSEQEQRLCRPGHGTGVYPVPVFGQQPVGMLAGAEWASRERAESMHEHRAGLVVGGMALTGADRRGTRHGRADRNGQREMSIQMARYLGVATAMVCPADSGANSRICGPDGTVLAELENAEGTIAAAVPLGRTPVISLNSARWKDTSGRSEGFRGRARTAVGSASYWSRWVTRDFQWQDSAHSDIPDMPDMPLQRPEPTHRAVVKAAPVLELTLTVADRVMIADDVVKLVLTDSSGAPLPPWRPGAHIDLVLNDSIDSKTAVVRQYSLCGNPYDPFYEIAVLKERDGRGGSELVHQLLHVGARVRARGPRNHFELEDADHYVFIAGGIGITPIRAMMHVVKSRGRTCDLFYGGRCADSMAFASELAEHYPLAVNLRPQDTDGLLDFEEVLKAAGDGSMIYACGPEPMLVALQEECAKHSGVRLRVERFVPAESRADEDRPVSVTVQSSNQVLEVPPGVSILSALQNADIEVDYSCQSGVCGSCEVRVLGGVPDHRDAILSQTNPDDRMMPCVSRALTPALILDL